MTIGILLFNLGGPDSLEAVEPFLANLFGDNDIIQLPVPGIVQRWLARRIARKRRPMAQHNYQLIGGRSPILPFTQAQADALQAECAVRGLAVKPYLAMRYWHPFTQQAVDQLKADGVTQVVLLPLYPHYSLATTGSSFRELNRHWPTMAKDVAVATVCAWYDHPKYLAALADTITQGLANHEWSCPPQDVTILFSAHGLPKSYVTKNHDPYVHQIRDTASLVMNQFFPAQRWQISYQSRVGPVKWLTPYTDKLLAQYAKERRDNVLVVPISFVSDHVETLCELDIEYLPEAREGYPDGTSVPHCWRAPALNTHPLLIETLADLVQTALHTPNPCRIRFPTPAQLAQEGVAPRFRCSPAGASSVIEEAVVHG
jgi:protoporphyrin/coproporphyrin ferrochelatase